MVARRAWVSLWLAAGAFCACGKPEYTIQRTLRAGAQWRYTLELQGEFQGRTDTLRLTYTDTVLSVQPDGSAMVERALLMPDSELRQLRAIAAPLGALNPKTRWRFFPNGKEQSLEPNAFAIGSLGYIYPDRPVRVGAQWGRLDNTGSLQVKYICQLEGIETLDGVRCYKIHTQIEPMPDSLPQTRGEMTLYVDAEHGWVRYSRGTLNMQAGELAGTFELQLRGAPVGEQP